MSRLPSVCWRAFAHVLRAFSPWAAALDSQPPRGPPRAQGLTTLAARGRNTYPVHCIQFTGFGWAVRSGAIISDLLGLVIFSAWNHCFAYAGQITLLSVAAIRRYLIIVRGYPQRSTSDRFIHRKVVGRVSPDEQISDSVTSRELHSPSHEQDRHI